MPKFIVCGSCEGTGGSSSYLGSFTSDEWNEMDSEWQDDYIAGNFDRSCPNCDGKRVVPCCAHPDCSDVTEKGHAHCYTHLSAEVREGIDDLRDMYAQQAAEMRFGC